MVALVRLVFLEHVEDAGVALQGGRMQVEAVDEVVDAEEAVLGVFEGDAADHAVDFIAFLKQELGEVGAVLAGD